MTKLNKINEAVSYADYKKELCLTLPVLPSQKENTTTPKLEVETIEGGVKNSDMFGNFKKPETPKGLDFIKDTVEKLRNSMDNKLPKMKEDSSAAPKVEMAKIMEGMGADSTTTPATTPASADNKPEKLTLDSIIATLRKENPSMGDADILKKATDIINK